MSAILFNFQTMTEPRSLPNTYSAPSQDSLPPPLPERDYPPPLPLRCVPPPLPVRDYKAKPPTIPERESLLPPPAVPPRRSTIPKRLYQREGAVYTEAVLYNQSYRITPPIGPHLLKVWTGLAATKHLQTRCSCLPWKAEGSYSMEDSCAVFAGVWWLLVLSKLSKAAAL